MHSSTDHIQLPLLRDHHVTLHLRREDLIHPEVSGNKFRKLKYNLLEARRVGLPILTFGGAYSNHIAATAFAGADAGIPTIGVIRGDELANKPRNPTLEKAENLGMRLHFVDRDAYRNKTTTTFLQQLREHFGEFYLLPEGGTNMHAVRGCAEILNPEDAAYHYICCAVGTGGTLAGLIRAAGENQEVLGFPVLHDPGVQKTICNFVEKGSWRLIPGYEEGGYAKMNAELVHFINSFRQQTGILLDPVYTAKMMRGILDQVRLGNIPSGSRVLAIHTGGIQGIAGMNAILEKKKLPIIAI